MNVPKETLHFVGHDGLMKSLQAGSINTMYVPDANLVLSLMQSNSRGKRLPGRHKHFVSISKQAVNRLWFQNRQRIPVNPVLAIMELTKQNISHDYKKYLEFHEEFFQSVYGVQDAPYEWVEGAYWAAFKACIGTHPSISRTIQAVYSFCPPGDKPSDSAVIAGCEEFFNWIWGERRRLSLIGGPLMYVSVYAICGSPQARDFIKYSKRSTETADNVAWDLLYWMMLEIDYHEARYENTVVCTSDHALAALLASRVNSGPRGQVKSADKVRTVEAYGYFSPVKFKRIENTKLEKAVFENLSRLLLALDVSDDDSIKFGFSELRPRSF